MLLSMLLGLCSASLAEDWPQWRGPHRDGRATESGLLRTFGDDGPNVVWRRDLGIGFSGISIRDGRLYTVDATGIEPDGLRPGTLEPAENGTSWVVALSAEDGSELWRSRLDVAFGDPRGSGPRSTPTLADGRLLVLSAQGDVVAFDLEGKELWRRDLVEEFGGEVPIWGYSASVLVIGELAIVPGGGDGRALLALDAATGEEVWSAGTAPPSYSSPILVELDGEQQIVQLAGDRVLGLSLDGEVLWSHPWPVINNINVATPLHLGGGRVLVATSYGVGSALLQIEQGSEGWSAREVWRSRYLKNHFQNSVEHRGTLYGFDNAFLEAVDAASGEALWRHRGLGKGSVLLVDPPDEEAVLVVLSERGRLSLVAPDPAGFRELAGAQVLEGRAWTGPSLADGQLYLRNESEILRVDLDGSGGEGREALDALLASVFEGRGGSEAWEAVDGFRLQGDLNRNGYLMELEIVRQRDPAGDGGAWVRRERRFRGMRAIVLWDGEHGWTKGFRSEEYEELPADRVWIHRLRADVFAGFPDAPAQWGDALISAGGGPNEVSLRTEAGQHPPVEWHFRRESPDAPHELVGTAVTVDTDDGPLEIHSFFFDAEEVAPAELVFPRTVEWDEGTSLLTLEVESVEPSSRPRSFFQPPR